ncbi:hypothetical protein PFISCL1PPCAC_12375, partial [Pristionchus fissidentatus]
GEGRSSDTRRSFRERIQSTVTALMPTEPKLDATTGKIIDPGTGILYEVGDRVYVRNMHFVEGSAEMGGNVSKRRTKGQMNRYLRGVVVGEDSAHPEFLYRVLYDSSLLDQDVLAYDMWPTQEDYQTDDLDSSWFAPWDISPSTYDLQCKRSINPSTDVIPLRCECDLPYCDLTALADCARTRSALCCARHPEGACSFHRSARKVGGRKRKGAEEREERSESRGGGERREDDPAARYIFKDGTLVRFTPIVQRPMELPEQILQD